MNQEGEFLSREDYQGELDKAFRRAGLHKGPMFLLDAPRIFSHLNLAVVLTSQTPEAPTRLFEQLENGLLKIPDNWYAP